jgi:hypothetical protein
VYVTSQLKRDVDEQVAVMQRSAAQRSAAQRSAAQISSVALATLRFRDQSRDHRTAILRFDSAVYTL